jgi:hypothetical protein
MKRSPTVSLSLLLAVLALGSLAFGQAGGDVRRRTIAITCAEPGKFIGRYDVAANRPRGSHRGAVAQEE